jgi:hypothetical protein
MRGALRKRPGKKEGARVATHCRPPACPITGRRRRRYREFIETRRESERELAKMVGAAASGPSIDPSRETVGASLDRWLRDYVESNVAPRHGCTTRRLFGYISFPIGEQAPPTAEDGKHRRSQALLVGRGLAAHKQAKTTEPKKRRQHRRNPPPRTPTCSGRDLLAATGIEAVSRNVWNVRSSPGRICLRRRPVWSLWRTRPPGPQCW